MKRYTQLILVEFDNTEPFLYKMVSDNPIKLEAVAKYFQAKENFNQERDSITFVDKPLEIEI